MLKYVSKFTLDVLPSLLATVIGAYIVNHYIVAKPDAPAVAAVSTTEPKGEAKGEAKASETPAGVVSAPEIHRREIGGREVGGKACREIR